MCVCVCVCVCLCVCMRVCVCLIINLITDMNATADFLVSEEHEFVF